MDTNRLYDIYIELINSWEETNIDEQRPIELALSIIINELKTENKETKTLIKELYRFENFRHDQNKLNNILSLLKICERLHLTYNKDIDLNSTSIDSIVTNIELLSKQKTISKRLYKQATKDLRELWFATNTKQPKAGDDYVFPNSETSISDIRAIIPYFDIEIEE